MLPGKRAAEGEVVVESSLIKKAKLDSLISTATTTITSETVPTAAATEAAVSTMGGGKSVNGNSNGKAPFERNSPDIDEDLHSRQLAVYGRETMRRLFASNILVSGMQGLGAEIAKNLVLAGVKSVILHDEGNVELWDLSSSFIFSEDDVGKNRALASMQKLQELNNSVLISTLTTNLTKDHLSDFQQCGNFISWCDEYVRVLHNQGRLQMDTSERLNVTTHPTNTNDSNELAIMKIEMRQLQLTQRFVIIVNVMYAALLLMLLNRL